MLLKKTAPGIAVPGAAQFLIFKVTSLAAVLFSFDFPLRFRRGTFFRAFVRSGFSFPLRF